MKDAFTQAVKYIYEHIDELISLKDIALHTGISIKSLKHLFQKAVEQTPGAFIRKLKMELTFTLFDKFPESSVSAKITINVLLA